MRTIFLACRRRHTGPASRLFLHSSAHCRAIGRRKQVSQSVEYLAATNEYSGCRDSFDHLAWHRFANGGMDE